MKRTTKLITDARVGESMNKKIDVSSPMGNTSAPFENAVRTKRTAKYYARGRAHLRKKTSLAKYKRMSGRAHLRKKKLLAKYERMRVGRREFMNANTYFTTLSG